MHPVLKWNNKAWPWAAYGPAIMTAVRAGVPVMGANLPRESMQVAMRNAALHTRLSGPPLKAQQQLIRLGHRNLPPENQIGLMTRIQIAKDISMANTLSKPALPGEVVVLLTGSGHAYQLLGVPLPRPCPAIWSAKPSGCALAMLRRLTALRCLMRCGQRLLCLTRITARNLKRR